jgi:hypothetical protein
MLSQLFEAGVLNVTFWCLFCFTLLYLFGRTIHLDRPYGKLVLAIVMLGTLGMVSLALYRGYSVPRDILQDIIAADEYLAGRSMHPDDMTQKMSDALAREGARPSVLAHWPDLQQKERERLKEALGSHWVQAHPPFMTLFTAAFVRYLGILGTQIAFFILSLGALTGMLWLLRRELASSLGWRVAVAVFLLILGWDPLLTILRSGQIGLALCGLLTLSWYCLRRDRPIAAGIAAAFAVALKLIPAVILVALVMRHRRAFASSAITIAIIVVGTFALTGWTDHVNYFNTSKGVIEEYAPYQTNLSLMGVLARGAIFFGVEFSVAKLIWMASGVLVALGMMILFRQGPRTAIAKRNALDLEFSLAMTVMPFLSPVAWDHYLTFLIFPLAIIAQRIARHPSRGRWLGYIALVLCLAIPDSCFTWLFTTLRLAGYGAFATWAILPIRAILVVVTAFWVVRLIRREEACPAFRPTVQSHVSDVSATEVVPVRRVLHGADLGAPAT